MLAVLFFAYSFGLICGVFYLVDLALFWADLPHVASIPPPPPKIFSFELGPRILFTALMEENVTRQDANAIINALRETEFDFASLRSKQKVTLKLNNTNVPVFMSYQQDKITKFDVSRNNDGSYIAKKQEVPTIRKRIAVTGVVSTSVYAAIIAAGEKPTLTSKFIEIFGWDIDFSTDTQKGDTFALILEKIETEKGEFVGYGKLFAGEYKGKTVGIKRGYYFDHPVDKLKGFYTESGKQLKKFMLRAPLDTMRVTSRFGFRMHPTQKKYKQHNGIDYGAPTGTPVWAVADGKVIQAARAGAAGNLIVIDHGDGLKSYYMHLSRIHVKAGQQVRQRKLIGRVGSTGRSTGPHLHFGLKQSGRWINPTTKKIGTVTNLDKKYMPAFLQSVEVYKPELDKAETEATPMPGDIEGKEKSLQLDQPLS